MKVLVVGGGSGGHVTPAVAVVREILERKPRTKVEFWTDRKYYKNVVKITTELGVHWGDEDKTGTKKAQYIRVRKIAAGKFRRYHDLKLADYFANGAAVLREVTLGNVGGFFGFAMGNMQAFFRLLRKKGRPDVIFLKGGYVGLPVGLVAKFFKIPYVIHESDAVPGLANRTLMDKAAVVAMGMPMKEGETASNQRFVGIPVAPEFKKVSTTRQQMLKKEAGFDIEKPLLMVTGGSQGSEHINVAIREILPELLKTMSVGLVAGRTHYEEMVDLKKYEEWDKAKLKSNFRLWSFSPKMHELLGAADLVISRAGATTIAELAALQKPVVLVPFEKLPGGHQVKNAERLAQKGAAEMVVDADMVDKPEKLLEVVQTLMRSPKKREILAMNLAADSRLDAAATLAEIIIEVGTGTQG